MSCLVSILLDDKSYINHNVNNKIYSFCTLLSKDYFVCIDDELILSSREKQHLIMPYIISNIIFFTNDVFFLEKYNLRSIKK